MASKKVAAKTTGKPASSGGAKAKPASSAPAKPAKKISFHDQHKHLFIKNPKVDKIGRDVVKRDLTRFVAWPTYIRLQRQKAILKRRLKVPPSINQFSKALGSKQAGDLFGLLKEYRPESAMDKKERLKEAAAKEAKAEGSSKTGPKPMFLKYGLNHVTTLIETKKAKLVVIAHDVEPLELVVWLPALCRKFDIPYVIVKGKARLGHLVYKKNAAVVALTDVKKEHATNFENIVKTLRISFNDNAAVRTDWGEDVMGNKFQAQQRKLEKAATKKLSAK